MTALKAKLAYDYEGRVARATLAAPKTNVLDRALHAVLGPKGEAA